MITPDLHAAYTNTDYEVYAGQDKLVIRIGAPHPAVDAYVVQLGISSWAFITAFNPRSTQGDDAENTARNNQLRAQLESRQFQITNGAGVGDDRAWAPEPSFFVAGISYDEALQLGRLFEQNAIVFGEVGGQAQLVLCLEDDAL